MIEESTVLILGAGASAPYGFPTGRGLLNQVVQQIHNEGSTLVTILRDLGFSQDHITTFAHDLDFSAQPSIDAFLESRPEFLDIGRSSIVAALIPFEDERMLRRETPNHWYEYLLNRLGTTLDEFARSQLSIITFNYDRSFEHFLSLALRARFGLSTDKTIELWKTKPVIHVYGQLGALDYVTVGGRPYAPGVDAEIIRKFKGDIRIVHEIGEEAKAVFRPAWGLIRDAGVICFLGFGYHRQNLARLSLKGSRARRFFGSSYGMGEAEIGEVGGWFKREVGKDIEGIGRWAFDILAFLRREPVLAEQQN